MTAVPPREATWGQTRSAFRTKSDPVALPPRIQFQLFNLYSGESEERFADFEAVEIGGELTRGRGEGLAEVIEGHGSVAGDLARGIGREQRLRHDLEAAFEEVVEAHVGAEQREEIVIQSAG